ncbi:MAG: hypothetical protein KY429_10275 [Actinobacteria bacterium]|nr:hypothetical protein [Actinomycetota bacterium]
MAEQPQPRKGRWIPLVYYYVATLIGLTILLIGLIGGLQGLVKAAIPQISDEVRFAERERAVFPDDARRDPKESDEEHDRRRADAIERARIGGLAAGLNGMVAVVVGAPVFAWHLRQARRKEPEWLG